MLQVYSIHTQSESHYKPTDNISEHISSSNLSTNRKTLVPTNDMNSLRPHTDRQSNWSTPAKPVCLLSNQVANNFISCLVYLCFLPFLAQAGREKPHIDINFN